VVNRLVSYYSHLFLCGLPSLHVSHVARPVCLVCIRERLLNAAARLVVGLRPFDRVTPALRQRHWLPVEQCIQYKLCLLMHSVYIDKAPRYPTDVFATVA